MNMKMDCSSANELIMKYFDHEINDMEKAQLMQHLNTCSICSGEFNLMKAALEELEAAEEIEPPEGFEAAVMEKVKAAECPRKADSLNIYSFLPVILYNLASFAAIILLVLFASDIRNADVPGIFSNMLSSIVSVARAAWAVTGVLRELTVTAADLAYSVIQAVSAMVESYYVIIIGAMALLVAIQKLLATYAPQDGGNV